MKKNIKTVSGLILVLAVLAVGAGQVFLSRRVNTTSTVPRPGKAQETSQTKTTQAPTSISATAADKTYSSDAGFRFSYPDDMRVAIRIPEDQNTYASLKLTSSQAAGNISIKIFDSIAKIPAETEPGTRVTLADLSANEIVKSNNITVAAREVNTVYLIESFIDNNHDYWQRAVDKVVNTFTFVDPDGSSGNESVVEESSDEVIDDSGSDDIEEIVE